MADIKSTLFLVVCLVILVIFLFLRNLSATIIPSLALPLSIVGTFALIYACDYTVDNLSLMALTLAIGFVVTLSTTCSPVAGSWVGSATRGC